MEQEHSLVKLFKTYSDLEKPPIIELLNIDGKPIGALYLSDMKSQRTLPFLLLFSEQHTIKHFLSVRQLFQ